MNSERDFLVSIGCPEEVATREAIFRPSSLGVIIHTGDFEFEERKRLRSGEPQILMVRQADMLIEGFHSWGIPAGRANKDEGIIEVARREVYEETGMNLVPARLKWFCPVGDRKAILSYKVDITEIPLWQEAEAYELGIKVIPLDKNVNSNEIDRLALVPVEVFADHMLVGSHRVFRNMRLKPNYLYYPRSEERDEDIDFIPGIYKPEIWQAIRHQMFVRRIIPPYLG